MDSVDWSNDEDYEEYEIKEVQLDRDQGERGLWVAKLEFDFILRWPRGGKAPQPKVGQTCRVFGDIEGKWGPRGVVVNEKVAFFRTPENQVKWVEAQESAVYIEAKLTFNTREKELQVRIQLLPEHLRTRIDAAREVAEDKERFDVYELEVEIIKYEHAHMLALVVDGLPTLETFSMIPVQTQMGYSWNAMCEGRREVIKKMLRGEPTKNEKGEEVPAPVVTEEVLTRLREDLVYLDRYQEQRFSVNHPPVVLTEIFQVAGELLAAEIAH
jgi:hypothetical protein